MRAHGLRSGEAFDQPLAELEVRIRLERDRQRLYRRRRNEDVSLGRVALTGATSGPFVAAPAGERRGSPGRVDAPDLPLVATLVGRRERLDRLLGRASLAQQRQPVGPVARVRVRLRRDRADVRFGPRDDRADREELRLHGDAPLPGLQVAGDDRIGGDQVGLVTHR